MQIEVQGHFIHFKAVHQVGQAMNAVYSKAKGTYRVPHTLGAIRELYQAGYDAKAAGLHLKAERDYMMKQKRTRNITEDSRLREYQAQDVHFLLQADHLANFSQMRTGKTPVMCRVVERRSVPTIVICPTSICLQWVDELHNWTTRKAAAAGNLTKAKRVQLYNQFERGEFDVLVVSIGVARQDRELLWMLL